MIGIREKAPEWTATAIMPNNVKKSISLSDYNGRYVALIFLSTSFNTSSLSDLLSYSKRQIEFDALNCQVIIVSNDSYYTILSCINSIDSAGLNDMKIPIVSDYNMNIVKRYGMYGDSDDVIMEGVVLISSNGIVFSGRHLGFVSSFSLSQHCIIIDTL
jgi:alkyl hydroperoxide reductase subunit AhpC